MRHSPSVTITIVLLACIFLCLASPVTVPSPRPLVIWHGLGDSYGSPGILKFMEEIRSMYPGIFVHSVHLADSQEDDRRASFYGNVNLQLENVTEQVRGIPELKGGFDAIGFSQAGQFLRAYVERYNSPPVHNLITFGAQHMGVADLPACRPFDVLCQLARRAAKGGVYSDWAQTNIVSAQYYRDQDQLPQYLEHNHFLPDINNEDPSSVNETYADNLKLLNKFVLVVFSEDKTVVPKESSWFGSYAPRKDDRDVVASSAEKTIIPMRLQPLYVNDTIGLKTIDERGDLVFETCEGDHMVLGDCWKPLVEKYVGGSMREMYADVRGQTVLGLRV
ncbi:alpha/beta-hydrolase [Cytidiella melzeri]|nr:alpha/beta-hydrolase [Cytidiella melzeri]